MDRFLKFLLVGLLAVLTAPSIAQGEEVDLELVLAMDASGSISHKEYILQLDGIYAAFNDPAIHAAIVSGPTGRIAVNLMLWSDAAFPKVNSGWYLLDSAESARNFAGAIENFQLTEDRKIGFGGGGTGIGAGIKEGLHLLEKNTYTGLRRVIDVSGDGVETEFWFTKTILVKEAKQLAVSRNVTINGLPILTDDFPELDKYYRANVISGPGAFVEKASGFQDFARAIKRKLLREISSRLAEGPVSPSRRFSSLDPFPPHVAR